VTRVTEVALFTADVEAASRFYRELTGVAPVAEWPGGAIYSLGETKLLVHERSAALKDGPPNEDHVALSVSDLDEACRELESHGVEFLVEPRTFPWGRSAYLRDPDGRLVELAEA
jgi:catechol 2,3-dioxygenase-like lactoylglutathione lyase family enzyme